MFVGRRLNLGSGSGELELVREMLLGRGILGMKSGERNLNRRVKMGAYKVCSFSNTAVIARSEIASSLRL